MAIGDISLTASMRATLVTLQQNAGLADRTQDRLASGKKVNTALDNPANFFAAAQHTERANRLSLRKDSIGEGIQTIKAADNGVKSIKTLLEAARGLVNQARTTTNTSDLSALGTQYSALLVQITNTQDDSSYKGKTLLEGDVLTVLFDEAGGSKLSLSGFTASPTDLLGAGIATTTAASAFASAALLDDIESAVNAAIDTLTSRSSILASNLSILTARDAFINDTVNVLTEGANKLTLADTNEEGANLLILQTRIQLGTTSLSLASQNASAVLRLF